MEPLDTKDDEEEESNQSSVSLTTDDDDTAQFTALHGTALQARKTRHIRTHLRVSDVLVSL